MALDQFFIKSRLPYTELPILVLNLRGIWLSFGEQDGQISWINFCFLLQLIVIIFKLHIFYNLIILFLINYIWFRQPRFTIII